LSALSFSTVIERLRILEFTSDTVALSMEYTALDRKHIYTNPSSSPNPNFNPKLNLKAQ